MKAKTRIQNLFVALAILAGVYLTSAATVFPIATNPSLVEIGSGIAGSGTNYLVSLLSGTNVCTQLVSTNGTLIGLLTTNGHGQGSARFSGGSSPEFPCIGFNGADYLQAWYDTAAIKGYGQIIRPNGSQSGAPFLLSPTTNMVPEAAASDGTNFVVVLEDYNRNFYGQFVTGGGALSGSAFLISSQVANSKSAAVAFGKTNYLVVFGSQNVANNGNTNLTYGVIVSRSGSVSSPFQIGQTPAPDHGFYTVAFDGANYLAAWTWDPYPETFVNVTNWEIFGRLVSQAGTLPGGELQLVTDAGNDNIPALAFDGSNYLLTWGYGLNVTTNTNIRFQFFNRMGNTLGSEFTVFTAQGANTPMVAINGLIYDGTRYAVAATLGTAGGNPFSSAAVYGAFLSPSVFPIATNAATVDLVGSSALASSGTNYLAGFLAGTNVCVQLVSTNGTLIGPPVTNGVSSKFPNPKVAFAGGNYLLYWFDNFADNLHAQLISAGGGKIGSALSLGPAESQGAQALLTDGTKFLLVFQSSADSYYHGQFVTSAGALSGSSFLIASEPVNLAGAYGAGNYFFVWQDYANGSSSPYDTYGVFVSGSGSVGSPFQINQTESLDQSSPAVGFDGTNFLAVWNGDTAQTASGAPIWNFYGALVSQAGSLVSGELLLNTNQPVFPTLAFDGTDYLLAWGFDDNTTNLDKNVFCQFLDRAANPVGSPFAPFPSQGTNSPIYGSVIFDGQEFVMAGTIGSISVAANGHVHGFLSGAVYGAFIPTNAPPSSSGPPLAGNLVVNGGFESGDFTGWTLVDSSSNSFVDDSSGSRISPHSGNYLAALAPFGTSGSLSQSLTTVPGQSYVLSLWLNSPDGQTPNQFSVSWNGTVLLDETNIPAIGWTNLQFIVTATGTSTVLQFGFRDDSSYLGLDDVSVIPSGRISPTVQFTASQTNGLAPLMVQFDFPGVDSSGTNIVSWNWSFGDGSISTAQHPSHTYTNAGFYTPSLVATNSDGSTVLGYGPAITVTNITTTVYMNFDSVDASGGPVDATTYLGSFGISLTNVNPPGSIVIFNDTKYYDGGAVYASSPHNFLTQNVGGSPNGITYTMVFGTPLLSLSFARCAIGNNAATPSWTATAYAGTNDVGSVGVCCVNSDLGQPAEVYTVNEPGITSLTITANGENFTAISSVPLDDFYMTLQPPPLTISSPAHLSNGQFQMTINGAAKQNYTVQMSTNLISTSWIPLLITNPLSGSFSFSDSHATNQQRFYRILVGP